MTPEAAKRFVAFYSPEVANIRFFLREKRTVSEFQDWLWKRVPKLKAVTTKVPHDLYRIGVWGKDNTAHQAVRYTDLLTCLVMIGGVERSQGPLGAEYQVVVDKPAKPSYSEELPY
jgi:hypothetical protein